MRLQKKPVETTATNNCAETTLTEVKLRLKSAVFFVNYVNKTVRCGNFFCLLLYICLWTKKIFESYFSDRLTFSNIHSRTSRQIYRLTLPLRAPETLFSLTKSRISIFNAHLTLLVRRMMSHNSIGKYRHLVN